MATPKNSWLGMWVSLTPPLDASGCKPGSSVYVGVVKRRRFLEHCGAAAAAGSVLSCTAGHGRRPAPAAPSTPRTGGASVQVAVVGAGLTGLLVAHRLQQRGYEVRVFEGSERAGGRVRTHRADGLAIEFGATRALGNHADLLALAEELNVGRSSRPEPPADTTTVYRVGGHRFEGVPLAWPLPLDEAEQGSSPGELAAKYIGTSVDEIGDPQEPGWPGPELRRLDALTRRQLIERNGGSRGAIELLELGQLVGWAEPLAALQSLRFSWGNDFSSKWWFDGGNEQLIDALLERTHEMVSYEHRVRRVRHDQGGAQIELQTPAGSHELRADAVVLAVPLSALRTIELDPAPPRWREASAEIEHVRVLRIAAIFDGRPWLERGWSGKAIADDDMMEIWDVTRPEVDADRGVSSFYVTGDLADRLAASSKDDRARWCNEQLQRAFPGLPPHERIVDHRWSAAWPAQRPGQLTRFLPALNTPTSRVILAGDNISPWPGWMQGSVYSAQHAAAWVVDGRREANR